MKEKISKIKEKFQVTRVQDLVELIEVYRQDERVGIKKEIEVTSH